MKANENERNPASTPSTTSSGASPDDEEGGKENGAAAVKLYTRSTAAPVAASVARIRAYNSTAPAPRGRVYSRTKLKTRLISPSVSKPPSTTDSLTVESAYYFFNLRSSLKSIEYVLLW